MKSFAVTGFILNNIKDIIINYLYIFKIFKNIFQIFRNWIITFFKIKSFCFIENFFRINKFCFIPNAKIKIASQIVSQLNKRITKTQLSNDHIGGIHQRGRNITRSIEAIEYVSYVYDYFYDNNYSNVENAKAVIPLLNRAIKQDSTYGEAYALSALARFILIENISDKAEISLEMQKILIDVETALIYDPYNELALAEKLKFKPFETKEKKIINDIKQYHNISNNLLSIRR